MSKITAADVNNLRKKTGAGMMDCKNALVESDGDIEQAIDYLRKKGQKLADKRADREANEGYVLAKANDNKDFGVVFILNCETDFVAKNEDFISFAQSVGNKALETKPNTLEELLALDFDGRNIQENLIDLVGKVGEKLEISKYGSINSDRVFAYNHQGNRLASLVGFNKSEADELGQEVAMQIAAMNPVSVDRDSVPQDVIDRELEIGRDIAKQEGKPEHIIEKIAEGKLNKFFSESTLIDQAFVVRDGKKTVGECLKEVNSDLKVAEFKRFSIG